MTIWDNILRLRFVFYKSRIVSRFVNSVKSKYINELENRLTPIAFYRNARDKKEMSVFCIDRYVKNFNRQNSEIWQLGDNVFKTASNPKALARGDLSTEKIEKICYDKDNKKSLFLVPSWVGEHCKIKPLVEDFHEDDVRVDKLADESHLVRRI